MLNFERPGQVEDYADTLQRLGQKCASTECIAVDALNFLYNRLNAGENDPCALIRFFRSMSFHELTPDLQERARPLIPEENNKHVNCLTLLASRGILPEWNDRFESISHQVIPLISPEMVESAPMIAQLIKRLGIDVAQAVDPKPNLFLRPKEKTYNVLYVPEALGDRAIVSQKGFVEPFKIRSVVGFGGLLPTGDMFAVMMFMRVFVSSETAERFGLLARGIEEAINTVRSGKKSSARILLALPPSHGVERLQTLLGGEHTIIRVDTIQQAISKARNESYDLIICDVQFDDSRMFELLNAIKRDKRHKPKPFICYKQSQSALGRNTEESVALLARVIGANCYLDAQGLNDYELKQTLEAYLPEEIWIE